MFFLFFFFFLFYLFIFFFLMKTEKNILYKRNGTLLIE